MVQDKKALCNGSNILHPPFQRIMGGEFVLVPNTTQPEKFNLGPLSPPMVQKIRHYQQHKFHLQLRKEYLKKAQNRPRSFIKDFYFDQRPNLRSNLHNRGVISKSPDDLRKFRSEDEQSKSASVFLKFTSFGKSVDKSRGSSSSNSLISSSNESEQLNQDKIQGDEQRAAIPGPPEEEEVKQEESECYYQVASEDSIDLSQCTPDEKSAFPVSQRATKQSRLGTQQTNADEAFNAQMIEDKLSQPMHNGDHYIISLLMSDSTRRRLRIPEGRRRE